MTEEKLKKILGAGEGIAVEFKESQNALPENVFESVCAFLNRIGGDLLLGVKNSGSISGIDPRKIEQIKTALVNLSNNPNKLDPPFMIFPEVFTINGKKVIYVRVPQSSQVHRSGKYIFDRNEDGDFKVKSSAAISRLYQRKSTYFTENKIFPYLQFKDLHENVFRKARNLIQSHRPDHPWLTVSNDEILKSAGLYRRDFETGKEGYTLAAALLFAKDDVLQQIVPAYKTDALLRFEDQDHYDDRREIRTNLVDAYDEIMLFIRSHLPDKFYMEGDIRVDLREKIFREVVANILIHREYTNAFPARLIIYRDAFVTENANNPVGHGPIDPDNFCPHPKNPAIVKFFQQLGRAEELGSGIRNIRKYLPLYSENSSFQLIEQDAFQIKINFTEFPGKTKISQTDLVRKKYGRSREELNEKFGRSSEEIRKKFGRNSEEILLQLLVEPKATAEEIAKVIGITSRAVEKNIAKLRENGIVKRIGSTKSGYWEIIKQDKEE
ncbi:putative DNA binding domain-containing protein [candidate division KSB1 bacterium]|nr:putative DNA binding domain-containing protein [candidate division KSB1 bacterium]